MNLEDGKILIKLARDSINSFFSGKFLKTHDSDKYTEKRGVFVTLHLYDNLRGCIGYPEPVYELQRAIIEASRAAAFKDPRFPAVTESEMEDITVEVTVLSKPKLIEIEDPNEYLDKIEIGKWGERYVIECIKKEYLRKYQYSSISDTENGFTIIQFGKEKAHIKWLNRFKDKGKYRDIDLIENDSEIYIEVKSTKTDKKDLFDVSAGQWRCIQNKGENYHIYRVYNVGKENARLAIIKNPSKLWKEGNLSITPVRIKI